MAEFRKFNELVPCFRRGDKYFGVSLAKEVVRFGELAYRETTLFASAVFVLKIFIWERSWIYSCKTSVVLLEA